MSSESLPPNVTRGDPLADVWNDAPTIHNHDHASASGCGCGDLKLKTPVGITADDTGGSAALSGKLCLQRATHAHCEPEVCILAMTRGAV